MDAYDGTMTFYAADPNDPILRAYMGIFPGLFQPLSEVPAELRAAPAGARRSCSTSRRGSFATYHVTQPETFYQRTDLWTVPTGEGSEQSLPTEAYYVVMRMPGEPETEFLLLQPMVPQRRPNMIAWVSARNDGRALRPGARLPVPAADLGAGAPADRGADQRRSADQLPGHALEPVRQQGDPRQPARAAGPGLDHLPAAGVPAVHRRAPSRSSSGSSSPRPSGSSGRTRCPRRCDCCSTGRVRARRRHRRPARRRRREPLRAPRPGRPPHRAHRRAPGPRRRRSRATSRHHRQATSTR